LKNKIRHLSLPSNKATIQELHDGFKSLNEDKSVKAIIVTGSGEKAFVAGADISEFAHFSVEEGGNLAAEGQGLLFDFVQNLSTASNCCC